ncbi:hypothetical protein D0T84_16005 [Dysgonomonas sp. 521]|uniref:hypothetical protein n=1 Tax=Dysgonomonas sp. 521 TaxID=2302932 RepID=UPI0013D3FE2B|nr:hypothetical protein [Dysgonomonas sp. 521]NDV96407.1 hypothetical protein [Dysgonomonas sp. 521]
MKYFTLLLFAVCCFSTSFAQGDDKEISIDGLGDFRFGSTWKEVHEHLVNYSATEDTKIFTHTENVIQATNLDFAGYRFNNFTFTFQKEELYFITFGSLTDKKETIATAFDELTHVFNNLYGEWSYKSIGYDNTLKVDSERLSWHGKEGAILILSKYYIEKEGTALINIGATKPIR